MKSTAIIDYVNQLINKRDIFDYRSSSHFSRLKQIFYIADSKLKQYILNNFIIRKQSDKILKETLVEYNGAKQLNSSVITTIHFKRITNKHLHLIKTYLVFNPDMFSSVMMEFSKTPHHKMFCDYLKDTFYNDNLLNKIADMSGLNERIMEYTGMQTSDKKPEKKQEVTYLPLPDIKKPSQKENHCEACKSAIENMDCVSLLKQLVSSGKPFKIETPNVKISVGI